MTEKRLNGRDFGAMLRTGAAVLQSHVKEINELNVFPIPDGDTGDNMLMTLLGGTEQAGSGNLAEAARNAADGMLLSARGNSGVILSQFFDGIAEGLRGLPDAGTGELREAFREGVRHAVSAVMEPVEGTILTVAREGTEYAAAQENGDASDFLRNFILEAGQSLKRTPDLLPVLKKAGVVDSGGAGLLYIAEGMLSALSGEAPEAPEEGFPENSGRLSGEKQELRLDLFTEDSVLEFGYCTELLLRLQNAKTDPETFDISVIRDYLGTVGNSVVIFKTGSIVKLHVHTMKPQLVLDFCQKFGEFLTVKIENMSLQHNSLYGQEEEAASSREAAEEKLPRRPYGIVAAVSGEGIQEAFRSVGADVIVDGGQSMNPSSEAFIEAFDHCNADTVFVFPNNVNVVLAARQAASLYRGSDIRVIESRTLGEGYAAVSMFSTECGDTEAITENLNMAMEGVITASVSRCVRPAEFEGRMLREGEYIGFTGKEILAAGRDPEETVKALSGRLDFTDHEVMILIYGRETDPKSAERVRDFLLQKHRGTEVYLVDGKQEIYDYILIVE